MPVSLVDARRRLFSLGRLPAVKYAMHSASFAKVHSQVKDAVQQHVRFSVHHTHSGTPIPEAGLDCIDLPGGCLSVYTRA